MTVYSILYMYENVFTEEIYVEFEVREFHTTTDSAHLLTHSLVQRVSTKRERNCEEQLSEIERKKTETDTYRIQPAHNIHITHL